MFLDQDKVELTLQKMYEMEKLYKNTPILVHTDILKWLMKIFEKI